MTGVQTCALPILRHLEYDRLTVTPKRSAKSLTPHEDEEELNDTIDVQLLSHLVGDVSEEGLDEAMLSSLYDLKASARKSKSDSKKKSKNKTPQIGRASCRERVLRLV